jgi:hypothetical protein
MRRSAESSTEVNINFGNNITWGTDIQTKPYFTNWSAYIIKWHKSSQQGCKADSVYDWTGERTWSITTKCLWGLAIKFQQHQTRLRSLPSSQDSWFVGLWFKTKCTVFDRNMRVVVQCHHTTTKEQRQTALASPIQRSLVRFWITTFVPFSQWC